MRQAMAGKFPRSHSLHRDGYSDFPLLSSMWRGIPIPPWPGSRSQKPLAEPQRKLQREDVARGSEGFPLRTGNISGVPYLGLRRTPDACQAFTSVRAGRWGNWRRRQSLHSALRPGPLKAKSWKPTLCLSVSEHSSLVRWRGLGTPAREMYSHAPRIEQRG